MLIMGRRSYACGNYGHFLQSSNNVGIILLRDMDTNFLNLVGHSMSMIKNHHNSSILHYKMDITTREYSLQRIMIHPKTKTSYQN